MMQTIYLTKDQVPAHLRNGYSGNKFRAIVTETVNIPADAGLWSGGSRDTYQLLRLSDGKAMQASDNMSAPWDNRQAREIKLESGFCVVEHTMFQGKDLGLRFYLHPSDAVAMLPAPAANLSETERLVLTATRSYKASYAGKDRYPMATDDLRYSDKPVPTRAQWDEAKQTLMARGYLNKAGAITPAGRNVIG